MSRTSFNKRWATLEERTAFEEQEKCPVCNAQWRGEDIYKFFLDKYKDEEKAKEAAASYGWSEGRPVYFYNYIGIELPYNHPEHYDGVSYWCCPECQTFWDRFTLEQKGVLNLKPPNV